jgi:hypothetical protein
MMTMAGTVFTSEVVVFRIKISEAYDPFLARSRFKDGCDSEAAEKKLAGAAKTSSTTKCVKDAVGC